MESGLGYEARARIGTGGRWRRHLLTFRAMRHSSSGYFPKSLVPLSYITLLWLLLMVGIDSSPQLAPDTKMVILGLNHFEWVDKNLSAPAYYPWRIFDAGQPAVVLPTLQTIARNTATDGELLTRVVSYYRDHEGAFQEHWHEKNIHRVQALYAMNLIHLSHPYGVDRLPETFLEYVNQVAASSCRNFAIYQSRILDAFGLPWRYVALSSGFHGWIEVKIGPRWEIFDATANVWIDHSAFELVEGQTRRYRLFYSPWSDIARPDARRFVEPYEPHYYQSGALRMNMPGLGIYFLTPSYLRDKGLRIEVWPKFCPGTFRGMKCVDA